MDNQGEQKRVEEPKCLTCEYWALEGKRFCLDCLSAYQIGYAEGVEASAKVAEETEKRSNSYNLYKLARFEIVRAIRSLLPSVDPTPAPVSSGGQSDDGLPVGGGKCKTCYWMGERFCEWDGDCINDSAYLADTPAPQPAPAKEENRDTGGGE